MKKKIVHITQIFYVADDDDVNAFLHIFILIIIIQLLIFFH